VYHCVSLMYFTEASLHYTEVFCIDYRLTHHDVEYLAMNLSLKFFEQRSQAD
jgi:hypothetical protein